MRLPAAVGLVVALGAPTCGASSATGVVAKPDETIRFERHCAIEEPYRVQAYGRFATGDAEADVLGLVMAGHAGALVENPVIAVAVQAMRLRKVPDWAGNPFSVVLAVTDGSRSATSQPATDYLASTPGNPPRPRPFRVEQSGAYDWLTFVEPGEQRHDADAKLYRIPPDLAVSHTHFPDADWETPLQLTILVRNAHSGEELALRGPMAVVPATIMEGTAPRPRRLGLVQTLNPFQEGGLFQSVRRAAKYRNCIDERRAAKRAFAESS